MYPNQAFSSGSYAEMLSRNPMLPHNFSESVGGQNDPSHPTFDNSFAGAEDSHVIPRTQLGLIDNEQNIQCQSLSLSLGTVMPSIASVPSFQYQYPGASFSSLLALKEDEANLQKEMRSAECVGPLSSGGFHGSADFPNSVLNSQYLKAAQELLDEIVNVRKALKQNGLEKQQQSFRDVGLDGSKDSDGKSTGQSVQVSSGPNGSAANSSCELSPAERQNLLDKKTKLLSMLDEVDKRYRHYCHQMQMVVSSFDMVAGCGAAEPYTALALRTISRHFRCLRDAISGQIQVTQRSLGEQEGIPRLRYVDQQLRQQKALQQLGVMRQAWRPQRGLPESSVSILRAWLFEHFLHPYPKDSEKIMLARQTGLTRNQVANWFINARVRLWKPMVEEMYKEEFGESEMSSNLLSENTTKTSSRKEDAQISDNKGEEESQDNLILDSVHHSQIHHSLNLENASSSIELHRGIQIQNSDQRYNDMNHNTSPYSSTPISINQNGDGCILASSSAHPAATYDFSELGNFAVNRHVSLALELRNCESDDFGMSSNDDEIHKRRRKALASSSPENDLLDYHMTDTGKQQHKFGNPHLLHEFVV